MGFGGKSSFFFSDRVHSLESVSTGMNLRLAIVFLVSGFGLLTANLYFSSALEKAGPNTI